MTSYPEAEVERAMRVQEIVMRVYAGKLNWLQAAEILHLSPRQIRRWKVLQVAYVPTASTTGSDFSPIS